MGIADAALTFEDYQRMIGPNHRLYLAGIIWYEDIFGITRKTKFCVFMGGPEYEKVALRARTNRAIPQSEDWIFSHVHNEAS
jgi:hypothetical protein